MFLDLCVHKAFLDLQNIRSEVFEAAALQQGSLVSVLEMFVFAQLISRPELTFLMKSGNVSVVRVPGPNNDDI